MMAKSAMARRVSFILKVRVFCLLMLLQGGAGSSGSFNPGYSNLDFLVTPAHLLLNLKADKNGIITIKRDLFKNQPAMLTVIAVDLTACVYRRYALNQEASPKFKDLRLAVRNALAANGTYCNNSISRPI
jgi:hypothetical protein